MTVHNINGLLGKQVTRVMPLLCLHGPVLGVKVKVADPVVVGPLVGVVVLTSCQVTLVTHITYIK